MPRDGPLIVACSVRWLLFARMALTLPVPEAFWALGAGLLMLGASLVGIEFLFLEGMPLEFFHMMYVNQMWFVGLYAWPPKRRRLVAMARARAARFREAFQQSRAAPFLTVVEGAAGDEEESG